MLNLNQRAHDPVAVPRTAEHGVYSNAKLAQVICMPHAQQYGESSGGWGYSGLEPSAACMAMADSLRLLMRLCCYFGLASSRPDIDCRSDMSTSCTSQSPLTEEFPDADLPWRKRFGSFKTGSDDHGPSSGVEGSWTPKVCRIMAFQAIVGGLGPFFLHTFGVQVVLWEATSESRKSSRTRFRDTRAGLDLLVLFPEGSRGTRVMADAFLFVG